MKNKHTNEKAYLKENFDGEEENVKREKEKGNPHAAFSQTLCQSRNTSHTEAPADRKTLKGHDSIKSDETQNRMQRACMQNETRTNKHITGPI